MSQMKAEMALCEGSNAPEKGGQSHEIWRGEKA